MFDLCYQTVYSLVSTEEIVLNGVKMRKLICLTLLFVASIGTMSSCFADDKALYKQVRELTFEVELLRNEIRALSDKVDRSYFSQSTQRKSWRCYMEDMQAGRITSRGASKADAQSSALDKCTQKGGVCFESNIECIKE